MAHELAIAVACFDPEAMDISRGRINTVLLMTLVPERNASSGRLAALSNANLRDQMVLIIASSQYLTSRRREWRW